MQPPKPSKAFLTYNTKIYIECNLISNMEALTELCAPNLQWLYIELSLTDPSTCNDVKWIAKLETSQLEWLRTYTFMQLLIVKNE